MPGPLTPLPGTGPAARLRGRARPSLPRLHRSYLELPARSPSVPRARRHARATLTRWRLGHLADDAELLVSELVTNAIAATCELAPAPVPGVGTGLLLAADRHWLAVLVWDSSTALPEPQASTDDGLSGRGLLIVEAISDRWGACADRHGKVVWALLPAGGREP